MNADYQWMDENYRARPGNGENERDMIDISLILKYFRSFVSNSYYNIKVHHVAINVRCFFLDTTNVVVMFLMTSFPYSICITFDVQVRITYIDIYFTYRIIL